MKLGDERMFAQTDGGLRILISRKTPTGEETGEMIVYERAYYELAFEVSPLKLA